MRRKTTALRPPFQLQGLTLLRAAEHATKRLALGESTEAELLRDIRAAPAVVREAVMPRGLGSHISGEIVCGPPPPTWTG